MGAGDTFGDLLEQRLLDLHELRGFDHVQDLLQLSEEHHLRARRRVKATRGFPHTRPLRFLFIIYKPTSF